MGFRLSKFIGGAAAGANQYLEEQRKQEFQLKRDEVIQKYQEKLANISASKSGASSSTLAELEHLKNIEDPTAREAEYQKMLNLKRGGFAHGGARYDASNQQIIDVPTTAAGEATVTGAKQDAKNQSDLEYKPKIKESETGAAEGAKNAKKAAMDAYEKLSAASSGLTAIDDAIAAIDKGAGTGRFEQLLPTIKSSTIELENARGILGLSKLENFKGSTTDREMNISFDNAIPLNMDEKDLRNWLVNQRERQVRAMDVYSDAIKYLSNNNNLGSWLEVREQKFGKQEDGPPVEGAKKAPDGNWYVQKDGKYFRVD